MIMLALFRVVAAYRL